MMKSRKISLLLCLLLVSSTLSVWAQTGKKKKNKKGETNVEEVSLIDAYYAELYGNATTQKILGNYEEAIRLFSLCIAHDKNIAAPYFEIADIYLKQSQPQFCIEYAKTAVKLAPEDKWNLLLLGSAYLEQKDYKSAQGIYEQLVKTFPGEDDYLLDLADVMLAQSKFKDAIEVYNKLEALHGIVPEISLQKKKLYQAMGKTQEGINELKKLIEAFPAEPEYHGLLAEMYLAMDKKDDALKSYEKVLEMDPTNPIIHLALASYYQEIGSYDKAFYNLKAAFANPDAAIDDKVKILLSYYELSLASSRRAQEADTLIMILGNTHPDDPKTWSITGDFQLQDEQYEAARQSFIKVVGLETSKYVIWKQLLDLDLQMLAFSDMLTHATEAAELFPTQPSLFFYKGLAELKSLKYSEALESLTMARDLNFDDSDLLLKTKLLLGDAYRHNGRNDDAFQLFEKLAEQNPSNPAVLNGFAYHLAETSTQLDKAKGLVETALKQAPLSMYYLDTYGWIFAKSGNLPAAKEQIEKAIAAGGDKDGEILEHYGDILFKSGDVTGAVQQWEKAKTLVTVVSSTLEQKILQQKLIE